MFGPHIVRSDNEGQNVFQGCHVEELPMSTMTATKIVAVKINDGCWHGTTVGSSVPQHRVSCNKVSMGIHNFAEKQ